MFRRTSLGQMTKVFCNYFTFLTSKTVWWMWSNEAQGLDEPNSSLVWLEFMNELLGGAHNSDKVSIRILDLITLLWKSTQCFAWLPAQLITVWCHSTRLLLKMNLHFKQHAAVGALLEELIRADVIRSVRRAAAGMWRSQLRYNPETELPQCLPWSRLYFASARSEMFL